MQTVILSEASPFLTIHVRRGFLSAVLLILFLCMWHWRVADGISLSSCVILATLIALYLAYGYIFISLTSRIFLDAVGLPFQLITGYFFCNSLLFFLALCSPFGMALNLLLLILLACLGIIFMRKPVQVLEMGKEPSNGWAPLAAIIISGLSATIWCGDVQAPLQALNGTTVFKSWPDVFIHAREISVFAQAHGISTIHDIKLAGGAAPLYHFASYTSPAAINALGGISAMEVYASFQLPFGILLAGLGAYCLVGSVFNPWAGVAALASVVLLPDAYQQGFANRYLSYNFLSQVNLGMLYGIACASLAWIFVFSGCQRGLLRHVLIGYGFLVLCVIYKAHIFVANSYLLMIFPMLFFTPLRRRWRIVIGIVATALFVTVVVVSQTNPRVPVLRLDGSGIGGYIVQLLSDYDPGLLKSVFTRVFIEEDSSKFKQLLYVVALLSVSTFGYWLLVLPAAIVSAWRKVPVAVLCFPVLVAGNYLLMAIGLAADSRGVGTPDELQNRPLVWAYFVVAAWTAGLLYQRWIGSSFPRSRALILASLAGLLVAFGSAIHHAPNLQTFPTRVGHESFNVGNAVPACLVNAAMYLRVNSTKGDIIQDSAYDSKFTLTALSERQLYVGAVGFGGTSMEQNQRMVEIENFMHMNDMRQVQEFASNRKIGWFLAHPSAPINWPKDLLEQYTFACDGYRLYRFPSNDS